MRPVSLSLCALFGVGCWATSGSEVLLQRSASDLGCASVEEVDTGFLGVKEVRGCGKRNIYVHSGGEQEWLSPLDRAPFELACDKAALTVSPLDPKTVGVSGCGKRAVYIAVFPGGEYGKWVLDSSGQDGEAPNPVATTGVAASKP